ncbi:amino acid ABC transporter permease [Longispora albida]|uniref:amino acid ABC transporter permease n=1 Tax=Longispora albida TaxID=203523 RepID=UPI00038086C7|nr:ABC transporter permease subunit [Longispora albida]
MTQTQKRRMARTGQYVLAAAVVLVVAGVADWPTITENFLNAEIARGLFPDIITVALRNTIVYTVLAFAFGIVLGVVLALMRLSSVGPYRWFAAGYIELFRGLPAMLVLFMVGYGIPIAFPGREIPGGVYGQVALGLGIVSSAYIAETMRAGIQAVPKGQYEAARTLGMSHTRAMLSIVLPQAFRLVVPPLTNEVVMLTKDSSLVFVLGTTAITTELAKFARDGLNSSANATPLVVGGMLYLVITLPLSYLARRLEHKS